MRAGIFVSNMKADGWGQGFEPFLGSKEAQKANRRTGARAFKLEDRAFSLSSQSSPAVRSRDHFWDGTILQNSGQVSGSMYGRLRVKLLGEAGKFR